MVLESGELIRESVSVFCSAASSRCGAKARVHTSLLLKPFVSVLFAAVHQTAGFDGRMITCKDVLIKMEVSFCIKCPVRSWDWLSSQSSLYTERIKSSTAAFSCWKGYVRSAQWFSDTFTDSPRAVIIREESEPSVTEQIPELQSPASSDFFIHHCFVMASYRKQRCAEIISHDFCGENENHIDLWNTSFIARFIELDVYDEKQVLTLIVSIIHTSLLRLITWCKSHSQHHRSTMKVSWLQQPKHLLLPLLFPNIFISSCLYTSH